MGIQPSHTSFRVLGTNVQHTGHDVASTQHIRPISVDSGATIAEFVADPRHKTCFEFMIPNLYKEERSKEERKNRLPATTTRGSMSNADRVGQQANEVVC